MGVDLDVRSGEFHGSGWAIGSGKVHAAESAGRPGSAHSWRNPRGGLELGKASDNQLVRYRRERVGFIFQSFNLLAMRSAIENVEAP
jgi:putative ABC transport system ATP-binding protein